MEKSQEKPKILIVDDERTILLSLGHLLKSDLVDSITCNRQDFARTAIDNYFFSVVILDLRLSGQDAREGLELLDYIQQKSPQTKIIVMTAYGSDEMQREVFAKGAAHYFDKPINLDDLVAKLAEFGIKLRQ